MNTKYITSWLIAITFMACSQLGYADEVSSIVRGGKLYDKWYAVIGATKPDGTHPAWPASNTKKKGATTHRCKSCHGWDLMGKDGAYASGSYKTGIGGLTHLQGAANSKVITALEDSTHGYGGKLSQQDLTDLAIAYDTNRPSGILLKVIRIFYRRIYSCQARTILLMTITAMDQI